MPPRKSLENADLYTIGWIAALPIERAAATAMLDERHGEPEGFVQHQADSNSYTWGRMGEHNLVIASLPAGLYGLVSAATTASNLLSSLPQIRVSLLVGIGGGIPRPDKNVDIRLGDIAVSKPEGTTGGVVQYDLGKARPGEKWENTGHLNMPPQVLLHALASLQAEHELDESRVAEFLESVPKLKRGVNEYSHQGVENDRLFKSSYNHVGGNDCRDCADTETIDREERSTTDPVVHYGIIASGNSLIKDSATRDDIVKNIGEKCICFEMEAAGLMNHFPCLVIRGICDYADSHKNDQWQRYASVTAAAYAKDLLAYVPSRKLQETKSAVEVMESIDRNVKEIHTIVQDTKTEITKFHEDDHVKQIKGWLSPSDTSLNLNRALQKRQDGTGSWFLQSEQFESWLCGTHESRSNQSEDRLDTQSLWLHGISGCGKTILSATIIEHLEQELYTSHITLNFFFDFNDTGKQTLDNLLRSLIFQLYCKNSSSRDVLDDLFFYYQNGHRQPTSDALSTVFLQMLAPVKRANLIIDALDECETKKELLSWIENLANSAHLGLQVILTSQKQGEIESGIKRWLNPKGIIAIQEMSVNDDIRLYVHERLRVDSGFEIWHKHPAILDEIETELMKKAAGMFRWAACQLDDLQKSVNLPMLRKSLRKLPKTLTETYARILAKIDEDYRDYAIRILQFLTYSDRPLTIEEAVDAMVVEPDSSPSFHPSFRIPRPQDIIKICSSLVAIVDMRHVISGTRVTLVQLAHHSVQQYLKSKNIGVNFPSGLSEIGNVFQCELDELRARACMAKVFLAYFPAIEQLMCDSEASQEDDENFPFWSYGIGHWLEHARLSESEVEVQEMILDFFFAQGDTNRTWLSHLEGNFLTPGTLPHVEDKFQLVMRAMYYACYVGLHRTAILISERAADVNTDSALYTIGLHTATVTGNLELVKVLLEKGANPRGLRCVLDSITDWGSFRDFASEWYNFWDRIGNRDSGDWDTLMRDELANYSGEESRQESWRRPLEYGREKFDNWVTNSDLMKQQSGLLTAFTEYSAAEDHTPLQIAVTLGHRETAKLLLASQRNTDFGIQNHRSALVIAAFRGHEAILQDILHDEGDSNMNLEDYIVAIRAAALHGHRDVMEVIIQHGSRKDGAGMTRILEENQESFQTEGGKRVTFETSFRSKDAW